MRAPVMFAEDSGSAPAAAEKVRLTFATPSEVVLSKEVDMVIVPAITGEFGVMPNYAPTVAQLKPGVVSVFENKDGEPQKWFVSGGFAIIKDDSTCGLTVVEAVRVEDLDAAAVQAGIEHYQQKVDSTDDAREKALAEIGLEVHTVMSHAISGQTSGAH